MPIHLDQERTDLVKPVKRHAKSSENTKTFHHGALKFKDYSS